METESISTDARRNAEQQLVTVQRRWGLVRAVCHAMLAEKTRVEAERILAEPASSRGRRAT